MTENSVYVKTKSTLKLKTHPANLQEIVYYRFKSDFFRQDRKNSQMGKATTLKRLAIMKNKY
jgi:hypothetical protein